MTNQITHVCQWLAGVKMERYVNTCISPLIMISCSEFVLACWNWSSVWIYRSVKTVIAIIARLEGAEWYCYRNRQILICDEAVSWKVTLFYLLMYTMVETQGMSKRKYDQATFSDLRIFTDLQILFG
jgi:hypothetical protein